MATTHQRRRRNYRQLPTQVFAALGVLAFIAGTVAIYFGHSATHKAPVKLPEPTVAYSFFPLVEGIPVYTPPLKPKPKKVKPSPTIKPKPVRPSAPATTAAATSAAPTPRPTPPKPKVTPTPKPPVPTSPPTTSRPTPPPSSPPTPKAYKPYPYLVGTPEWENWFAHATPKEYCETGLLKSPTCKQYGY